MKKRYIKWEGGEWLQGINLSGSQVTYILSFIHHLISQELSTFAEEVEKEVIGKNEVPKIKADYPELGKLTINTEDFHRRIERNGLRAKQRQALINLKTKRGLK